MHLEKLEVSNFRALTNLTVNFKTGANILVGPNAVGKTTVLEAIRLNKAMLSARTPQESKNVLISLSVTTPQLPQALNYSAIAGDPQQQIVINSTYRLTDSEIGEIPGMVDELSRSIAAAQVGLPLNEGPQFQAIQFFASPMGQQALINATRFVQENIVRVTSSGQCLLSLIVDPNGCQFRGNDIFSQMLLSQLDSRLSPYKSKFSYFTADRALPFGDPAIQIGSVDAQQQMESHNSNPSLKFQRFKNTIFSAFVESPESQKELNETFKLIFRELLKEKEIIGYSINRFGQASISIKDTKTGKVFDIDSLSSGEKGVILTFLIISRSISNGGLVLIDEPELHLNPAVCKEMLPFLVKNYLKPLDIQAVICTHSPEMLSAAMRMEGCNVFHVRQSGSLSPIRKQDQPEVIQALKLLGTSEVEEMLYDAVVFVEGPDDVELLEIAFPNVLSRIKFRELFGRAEVEKHIQSLQDAEKNGQKENISYFLFDRDRKLTGLSSSKKVKVKQWHRYCLENYLIEQEILFDLLNGGEFKTDKTPTNLGEAFARFANVAKKQLREIVIEDVYADFAFDGVGMRKKDRDGKSFVQAADILFGRIEAVKNQLSPITEADWKKQFIAKCDALVAQREQEWNSNWIEKCSGKQFISDLYPEFELKKSPALLKKRLLQENKYANNGQGTESWKLLAATVSDLIQS
ncbi:AAA family ATPase [Terracidiphilus gabretensis]|uniref:AAA family ATPase n=1 Tax=Terracidiphilus gabretensis TaxID=1577687 RepID=UPI00071C005A|nr:ATP-binding protein [Terracidiphilus gabretensis]